MQVELAVGDVETVEGREPDHELAVGRSLLGIADVGRDDAPVGEDAAAEVVGAVGRVLVGRDQPSAARDGEVAHDRAAEFEDAPAGGWIGLVRVLAAHEERLAVAPEQADLPVDVPAGRVAGRTVEGVVGRVDLLRGEGSLGAVGPEVVALGAEHHLLHVGGRG